MGGVHGHFDSIYLYSYVVGSKNGKQETEERTNLLGVPVRPWHDDHGTTEEVISLRAGKTRKHWMTVR